MLYLGIDVHKDQSHFHLRGHDGKQLMKDSMKTSPELFAAYVRQLRAEDAEGVKIALEAGELTFPLARAMRDAGGDVFVVNPYINALIAKSRQKDDPRDAETLSDQRHRNILPEMPVYIPSEAAEDLRRLVTARARLVKERTALVNRAMKISRRHRLGLRKGQLKSESGWSKLLDSDVLGVVDAFLGAQYRDDFLRIEKQRKAVEQLLEELTVKDFDEEYRLLRTVPGVGPVTASTLIAFVEDIERFPTARHLTAYLGLIPGHRKSAGKGTQLGVTCLGNSRLRGYFTQAALGFKNASPDDAKIMVWFEQIKARRGWKRARVALARKLVAVCFGIWKHRRPYDPNYDARAK